MLFIQLQEYAIPAHPLPSLKIRMAMSRQRKVQPELWWCQNDQIFNAFSDFQKRWNFDFLDFCILNIRIFWISGKRWIGWRYLGSAGGKMTGFLRAFQISACTYLVVKAPEGREG